MPISEEQWRQMKFEEIYGMYCRLDEKIEALKKRADELEKRLKE